MIAHQTLGNGVDLQWISIVVPNKRSQAHTGWNTANSAMPAEPGIHQQRQDIIKESYVPEPNKRAKVDSVL